MPTPIGKQPCFLCKGEGRIWPLENKMGIPKDCPTCKGAKYIEDYFVRCPHYNRTNKIYDNDNGRGFPKDCKLCNKLGYIDFVAIPCIYCDHNRRAWLLK